MVVELILIVGGIIYFRNRKKRKEEERARQEWYASGHPPSSSPSPAPHQYSRPTSPAPGHKPPAPYANTAPPGAPFIPPPQQQFGPSPAYNPGDYPSYAPPAYGTLQSQGAASGYAGQSRQQDVKNAGSASRP
ncbi:hypothetical protein DRE_03416 [Drechslerella stenobrocha 248]|uniref:Uncharacterized protein n=1 Tax=Drechslerella stenobrocha 248 TaxID=1043628 RepID=W7I4C1_9PEZI|nr:hypothetical protein DRE_03416 [Drechslerella stenobrocha 248]